MVVAVLLFGVTNLVVVLAETIAGFADGKPDVLLDELPGLGLAALFGYALWRGWRIFRWFFLLITGVSLTVTATEVDSAADAVRLLAIVTVVVLLLVAPDTWRTGRPAR